MIPKGKSQNKNNKATKATRKINRKPPKKNKSLKIDKKRLPRSSSHTKIKKKINSKVNSFFNISNLDAIARRTGFLLRDAKITPFIFIYALSIGLFGVNISLDLLAIQMNTIFGTDLTGQAFCLRMDEKKSVNFLKSCFESFLSLQLESSFLNNYSKVFSMFKGVMIEDSTTVILNEHVKEFKGSGGAASKSSLKLNWVFNICLYAAVAVDLYSGNIPDQKNAKKSIKHIKKGMLIIRDLGYFIVEAMKKIEKKKAYYLSRLRKGTYLYQNKDDVNPIELNSFFKKNTQGGKSVKIPIFIGKEERFSTNLVLQKVPKWVLKQRIKQYKKKNSGKAPSSEFITWAGYSVFITNIPDELLQNNFSEDHTSCIATIIMEIYKIRWQIELIFKKIKSIIKLDIIKGKSKNRVLCLIYGRLISIMLSLMVLSYVASHKYNGREVSFWKVTAWLTKGGRLANAIFKGTFSSLYSDCLKHFKLLCKDGRKRKTSLESIEDLIPWKIEAA